MFSFLPKSALSILDWTWAQYEPYFQDLIDRPIDATNVELWLADWSRIYHLANEVRVRLNIANMQNTADPTAEAKYRSYLEDIEPHLMRATQTLKKKLLASRLEVENFGIQLRNMQTEAKLFREENLPLLAREQKLSGEYDKIAGSLTVDWEGKVLTLPQLVPVYQDFDRAKRARAWRLSMGSWLSQRAAVNTLWKQFMNVRRRLAANAGCADYIEYRWAQMLRFDYTPDDCQQFHQSIEDVIVPAAARIREKRRKQLGVDTLRPWDLDVDPLGRPPLKPFNTIAELTEKVEHIFRRLDPTLGEYFSIMRREDLLDLDNRPDKAPGGGCIDLAVAARPFIFMNAVGTPEDVQVLVHESGHAFHVFESIRLPYAQQRQYTAEIAELAAMSMEFLTAPYFSADDAAQSIYSPKDAARAWITILEYRLLSWPSIAMVDAFQHWVYRNHAAAEDPANCDAKWGELWDRYMVGIDFSGLEQEKVTGWHHKPHIHRTPLYYIDYGLALLGAVQLWANAQKAPAQTLANYRQALALGATKTLPELFAAAGVEFTFDAKALSAAVTLMEDTINALEEV